MVQQLYANNAKSTLASALGTGSTSIVLSTGTGALFPNPATGQQFYATLFDAATELVIEIVAVTHVVGDTLTVVRAQQGTTAHSYIVGDFCMQNVTAGDLGNFLQQSGVSTATLLGLNSSVIQDVEPDTTTIKVTSNTLSTVQVYGEAAYIAILSGSNLTGTITLPTGTKKAKVRGWGPGGCGGGGGGGFGSGGGGGGYFEGVLNTASTGFSYSYVVGALVAPGGTAYTATGTSTSLTGGGITWTAAAGQNGGPGSSGGGVGSGNNAGGTGSGSSGAYFLPGGGGGYGLEFNSTTGAGAGGTCGSAPFFANPAISANLYSGSQNGQPGGFAGVGGGGGVGSGTGGPSGGGMLLVEWWS